MNSPLIYDVAGDGLPILCLHGHPGSRACMKVFTESLSQDWKTIAPDLRGYGATRATAPYEMQQHLLDILLLLDRLNLTQVIVLGWSLGGIIGTELALTYPERVHGLVLVASSAYPRSDHPPISWRDYFFTIITSLLNRFSYKLAWNRSWFGRRSLYRYLIQTHSEQTYRYLAKEAWPAFFNTSRWAHQALNQSLKAGYNRLDQLHQIACPALILAGECDRHITPDSSFQTHQHLKNSEWICYPKTAHLFPWEIPERVNADIHQWLNQKFG